MHGLTRGLMRIKDGMLQLQPVYGVALSEARAAYMHSCVQAQIAKCMLLF